MKSFGHVYFLFIFVQYFLKLFLILGLDGLSKSTFARRLNSSSDERTIYGILQYTYNIRTIYGILQNVQYYQGLKTCTLNFCLVVKLLRCCDVSSNILYSQNECRTVGECFPMGADLELIRVLCFVIVVNVQYLFTYFTGVLELAHYQTHHESPFMHCTVLTSRKYNYYIESILELQNLGGCTVRYMLVKCHILWLSNFK